MKYYDEETVKRLLENSIYHTLKDCPFIEIFDNHGRIVDVENVMNQITICFAECRLKNVKVTPLILATYIAKVPAILEAMK